MSVYLKNFLRFCFIILIQVLILNEIPVKWGTQTSGLPVFNPILYPIFILLLPFETPIWLMLALGFFTGITMDTFMNTGGIHAFSTVLIAYLRTNVLNALLSRDLEDYPNQYPSVKNMGWVPFLVYSSFLMFIHQTSYFIIESWSTNILYISLKILSSVVTSMLFVMIYALLFTRQQARV